MESHELRKETKKMTCYRGSPANNGHHCPVRKLFHVGYSIELGYTHDR